MSLFNLDLEYNQENSLQFSLYLIKEIEMGSVQKIQLNDTYFYIVKLYEYYISGKGVFLDLNELVSNENYIIEDILIDTIIPISSNIKEIVYSVTNSLVKLHILYRTNPPIQKFNSLDDTRKKFIDITGPIQHVKPGVCTGNLRGNNFISRIAQFFDVSELFHPDNSNDTPYFLYYRAGVKEDQPVLIIKSDLDTYLNNFKSSAKRLAFISLILIDQNELQEKKRHANIIFIDRATQEIERFDPNGFTAKWASSPVDEEISKLILNFFHDYTYVTTLDYCPLIGPQMKIGKRSCPEDSGFCVTLIHIYAYLRMLNLEYNRKEIIDVMMTYTPILLRKFNTYVEMIKGL